MGFNVAITFPFFELPVDVQVEVLRSCDAGSLRSFIQTCRQARSLYRTHAQTILKALIETKPRQFQYIIRTVLALRQGLLCPDDNDLESFLEHHLEPTSHAFQVRFPSIPTLRLLHEITSDINIFAELFFEYTVSVVYRRINNDLGLTPPTDWEMSYTERYRIERALWRLALFVELYRPCPWPGTHLSFRKSYKRQPYYRRLTRWEYNDMVILNGFLQGLVYNTFPLDELQFMSKKEVEKYWKKLRPSTFLPQLFNNRFFSTYSIGSPSRAHECATVPTKLWDEAGEANNPSACTIFLDSPAFPTDAQRYQRWGSHMCEFEVWDVQRFRLLLNPSANAKADDEWYIQRFCIKYFTMATVRITTARKMEWERLVDKLTMFWEVEG